MQCFVSDLNLKEENATGIQQLSSLLNHPETLTVKRGWYHFILFGGNGLFRY